MALSRFPTEYAFRKIIENLFWAWIYNLAAIPIAALGLLHPMVGVVAMTTSSLTVIGNSLLLKRTRLELNLDKQPPLVLHCCGSFAL